MSSNHAVARTSTVTTFVATPTRKHGRRCRLRRRDGPCVLMTKEVLFRCHAMTLPPPHLWTDSIAGPLWKHLPTSPPLMRAMYPTVPVYRNAQKGWLCPNEACPRRHPKIPRGDQWRCGSHVPSADVGPSDHHVRCNPKARDNESGCNPFASRPFS